MAKEIERLKDEYTDTLELVQSKKNKEKIAHRLQELKERLRDLMKEKNDWKGKSTKDKSKVSGKIQQKRKNHKEARNRSQ